MRSAAVIVATGVLLSYPLTLVGEDLFVLAAFDRSPDTAAVEHMRQETARIFADTGATLAWRTRTQPGIMPPGAVRVTLQLHGSCRVEPNMLSLAEDGPMGWVESHGGADGRWVNASMLGDEYLEARQALTRSDQ